MRENIIIKIGALAERGERGLSFYRRGGACRKRLRLNAAGRTEQARSKFCSFRHSHFHGVTNRKIRTLCLLVAPAMRHLYRAFAANSVKQQTGFPYNKDAHGEPCAKNHRQNSTLAEQGERALAFAENGVCGKKSCPNDAGQTELARSKHSPLRPRHFHGAANKTNLHSMPLLLRADCRFSPRQCRDCNMLIQRVIRFI